MARDQETILPKENSPLYSNIIWVTTLADLYLVLLVFFIMLNNISSADKIREKKAIDSVMRSFSQNKPAYENEPQVLDLPTIAANYLNNIEGLLNGAFKQDGINIKRSGNKMVAKVATSNFFEDGQAVVKDKHRKFFKALSGTMLQKASDVKVSADIMVESKAMADSAARGDYTVDISRAKIIAGKFEESGFTSADISSGVSFGAGDNIVMKFTVVDGVQF